MFEYKPLQKIMQQYLKILEKYENKVGAFGNTEFKRIVGEVRLFWYRQQKYVRFLSANIAKEDDIAYLAGAVRLDVVNNGHCEFVLVGKYRLINDPILKMSTFYQGTENDVNFNYINQYLSDCIKEMLVILREYPNDFFFFPMEPVLKSDENEYRSVLLTAAKQMVGAFFGVDVDCVENILSDCTYEEIESKLLPKLKKSIVFDSLADSELPLREKCEKYLEANGDIWPILKEIPEAKKFFIMTSQYCMQVLSIASLMKSSNIIPFIRNDITFNYFSLLFSSNIMEDFTQEDYWNAYIPFVLQRWFDFSAFGYENAKNKLGNGVLIYAIISQLKSQGCKSPTPTEIIQIAEEQIKDLVNK